MFCIVKMFNFRFLQKKFYFKIILPLLLQALRFPEIGRKHFKIRILLLLFVTPSAAHDIKKIHYYIHNKRETSIFKIGTFPNFFIQI